MDSGGSTTDQLFFSLEQFRLLWPKQGWSWDSRFTMIASSFHVDLTSESEQALKSTFIDEYDHRTLLNAVDAIQDAAESVGGVRADQRLYAMRSQGRIVPYALWWPWGDEITISVRIGLAGYVSEQDLERLRTQFNVI